jgi:hypothetical protein
LGYPHKLVIQGNLTLYFSSECFLHHNLFKGGL